MSISDQGSPEFASTGSSSNSDKARVGECFRDKAPRYFQMMGVFAEFERSMIVERVRSGIARAKATGTKSGKAFGRPRTSPEVEQRIREALASPGRPGFHKIAAQIGVATGTVQRIANG
jgi:DNA invertase Pin-like site-specific DNA recombinase